MSMILRFLGAAQNVTGSSYAIEFNQAAVLVDCGLYQERDLQARNWAPYPIPAGEIRAVLLTHAHLDHCGRLPRLVREGFRGPVWCTPATAEITRIVLLDAAKIQEEDALAKARRHAREGRQGPHPDEPLYTIGEAEAALPLLKPVACGQPVTVAPGMDAVFYEAGHILGSAMIQLTLRAAVERTLLFTGDLGRPHLPILRDPASGRSADYVTIESTYGDRLHEPTADIPEALARVINAARQAGGKVVIPAFAIERTQELLYYLSGLLAAEKIPRLPVFIDSPMAARITEVFKRHIELADDDTLAMVRQGRQPYDFPGLRLTATIDESKAVNAFQGPAVIIAGSGMCTGGRIKHHLINTIGRPENTILFVGYQASGTLGRQILDGAREVRILGQWFPVRARVAQILGFSAHADRNEMLAWLKALTRPPRRIFVTHGEAATAQAFAACITEQTGWPAAAPAYGQREELD